MAWTYSGDPRKSAQDAVRFEIPDTVESNQLVSDEEVAYTIEQESGVYGAAARCCESIARRYTLQVDLSTGDLKLTYSKAAETFAKRARELRLRAQGMQLPWSGGQSEAEKEGLEENTDRVQPRFKRGEFESPYAVPNTGDYNQKL